MIYLFFLGFTLFTPVPFVKLLKLLALLALKRSEVEGWLAQTGYILRTSHQSALPRCPAHFRRLAALWPQLWCPFFSARPQPLPWLPAQPRWERCPKRRHRGSRAGRGCWKAPSSEGLWMRKSHVISASKMFLKDSKASPQFHLSLLVFRVAFPGWQKSNSMALKHSQTEFKRNHEKAMEIYTNNWRHVQNFCRKSPKKRLQIQP